MEQIFWVKNGDLDEINSWLQKGGRIKMIQPVSETISAYGYHAYNSRNAWSGHDNGDSNGYYVGDIYAYVVIEFD